MGQHEILIAWQPQAKTLACTAESLQLHKDVLFLKVWDTKTILLHNKIND